MTSHTDTNIAQETVRLAEQLHANLDETLKISAPIVWELAPRTCVKNLSDNHDCTGYHRLWQYLMLWGVTTSMRPESTRFIEDFRELARGGEFRNIFISATADYNMLAHVLSAYQAEAAPVDVTVLDICETPLVANRWYAEHMGASIETIQADIYKYEPTRLYDVVTTHSFFLWVSLAQQNRLIKKWHEMLRPGGKLITSTRLYAGELDSLLALNEEDALDFRDRVRQAAVRNAADMDISEDPDVIAAIGYDYMTRNRKRYVVNSVQVYRDLFEKAGYEIECMELCDDSKRNVRPTGPTRGNLGRLHIIARRV